MIVGFQLQLDSGKRQDGQQEKQVAVSECVISVKKQAMFFYMIQNSEKNLDLMDVIFFW